ncbi:MAG: DUF305 domain-containing protein, partial [Bryobacteraceae bacterium]
RDDIFFQIPGSRFFAKTKAPNPPPLAWLGIHIGAISRLFGGVVSAGVRACSYSKLVNAGATPEADTRSDFPLRPPHFRGTQRSTSEITNDAGHRRTHPTATTSSSKFPEAVFLQKQKAPNQPLLAALGIHIGAISQIRCFRLLIRVKLFPSSQPVSYFCDYRITVQAENRESPLPMPGSSHRRDECGEVSPAQRPAGIVRTVRGGLLLQAGPCAQPMATMSLSSRFSAAPQLAVALLAAGLVSTRLSAQAATASAHDYTQADVTFMQGMIYHHAQAVVMSDWAPTHGASPSVATVCKRIALSQRDEITLMQHWLEARNLPAPDPLDMLPGHTGTPHDTSGMNMPGMNMGSRSMMMPGMLSPDEMRALEAAHGSVFDHLYLTGMIKHHQGALGMVATLFDVPGSGQQPELFSFATDIDAGQRAEIGRMQAILKTLTPSPTQ